MLKSLAILAAVFVVVFAGLGISQAPSNARVAQSNGASNTSQSSHANSNEKASPKGSTESVTIYNQVTPNQDNDTAGNASEDIEIQRQLAKFTKYLVWVGAGQAAILFLTICAIWGQTRANKNSARAWILVNRITNPVSRLKPTEENPGMPGIGITFQVYGNTPAKITDYKFTIRIVARKPLSVPPIPDLRDKPIHEERDPWELPIFEENVMLSPRRKLPIVIYLKYSPDVRQLESLEKRESFLCAYGFIKYKDVFGRKGKTSLCYVYYFAQGGTKQIGRDGPLLDPSEFRIGGPDSYNRTS